MNAERPTYYGGSPRRDPALRPATEHAQPPRGGSGQSKGEPSVVGGSAWRYKRAWSEAVDERDRALAELAALRDRIEALRVRLVRFSKADRHGPDCEGCFVQRDVANDLRAALAGPSAEQPVTEGTTE